MKANIILLVVLGALALTHDGGDFILWLAGVAFGATLISTIREYREGRA